MSRPPLRTALDRGWLLQVAFVLAFLEIALRIGLGRAVHPFLYLLAPPVVAVVGFGYVAPQIRTRVLDERRRYAVDSPSGIVPRLLVVAVVGHLFAVGLGTAAFILLDTPLQALGYWLGDGSRNAFAALAWPVTGVVAGTAVAWVLPALVVAAVSEGLGLRRATACALDCVRDRSLVPVVGVHLLGVVSIVVAVAIAALLGLVAGSPTLFFVLAGALAVLLVTVPLAVAMLSHIGLVRGLLADEQPETDGPSPTGLDGGLPVATLALVALLVVSLVTLAGAARMAELRPMDSPDPLGGGPDELYTTAVENTAQGSYAVTLVDDPGGEDERVVTYQIDRDDRQIAWEWDSDAFDYISTGGQTVSSTGGITEALRWLLTDNPERINGTQSPPNYFEWADESSVWQLLGPSDGEVTGWKQTGTDGDEVTLELTDTRDVLDLVAPNVEPNRVVTVNESNVRVIVDTEAGTARELRIQFDATLDPGSSIERDQRYTIEEGIDVERPDELGSPSLEEYVWRLLLY